MIPFVDLRAQYRSIQAEIDSAVRSVIESAGFVGGPTIERFERSFAEYLGVPHVVGVANGTDAIELALRVAEIGPGDEVIVPANTFFATAEAVSNIGATPVFADVDERTFLLSKQSTREKLTSKTKAIIPVHLYGRAMELGWLEKLCAERNLKLIEDSAQAHGASKNGRRVGSSGRLTCYSFYPGKNLGAYGDAGAISTADEGTAVTLRSLRDHGSPERYVHVRIGRNSRLDAIQAAVLAVKLPHLDGWNQSRWHHAQRYNQLLAGSSVIVPELPPPGEHVFHLYVVRSKQRDALLKHLGGRGIGCGIHYPFPLHRTPAYRGSAGDRGALPTAEKLSAEILSLPMFPELTESQQKEVAKAIHDFGG